MKWREYFLYAKKIKITTFLKQLVSSLSLLITVAPFWILPIKHFCMRLNARMHYFHSNQSVNACRICILALRRMQNSIRCLHSMGNIQNGSTVTCKSGGARTVCAYYSDDEIRVTPTLRCSSCTCTKWSILWPLHHHHQPETLRHVRMDPCIHVLYAKFWPYHLNIAAEIETHQTS